MLGFYAIFVTIEHIEIKKIRINNI